MSSFPDKKLLHDIADAESAKVAAWQSDTDRIVTASGALLNWVGDILSDEGWTREEQAVDVDALTLTGTNPAWNAIVIDRAERSPKKLRELWATERETRQPFESIAHDARPILVRREGNELKVFDGMHRTLAAIRDGKPILAALIGTPPSVPRPTCEAHVVYDLLRPWQQHRTTDRAGLLAALRYLRRTYGNVDSLLVERFGPVWIPDQELQSIIQEALRD